MWKPKVRKTTEKLILMIKTPIKVTLIKVVFTKAR